MEAWWKHFGAANELRLLGVHRRDELLGVAPLMLHNRTAYLCGGADVCDYLDVTVNPVHASLFFEAVVSRLLSEGVSALNLGPVRPDSFVHSMLPAALKSIEIPLDCRQADVSYELALPSTWEAYLALLSGKQRHEVRRKLRRLENAGQVHYRVVTAPEQLEPALAIFFGLFTASRQDKAAFMDTAMSAFFRTLAFAMARSGRLHLAFLELDRRPIASVLCFKDSHTLYLYNSGYDPDFRELSAGLLCKVFSLRHAITNGCRRYDFLKGTEDYKRRLGGMAVPLYTYRTGHANVSNEP